MGSEPAVTPTISRRLDADGALNVQRVLAAAEADDGFSGLSDQLAADLDDVVNGSGAGTFVATVAGAGGGLVAVAVATMHAGGWTVQTVIEPPARPFVAGRDVLRAALDEIAAAGGGRVDWWVFAAGDDSDAIATELGLRLDRELHMMRRPLPLDRRAEVVTRGLHLGMDEDAWLAVNNRAFAGHHEQGGWTLETLKQRTRQPWFDPDDVRLYTEDDRLAAFCWVKLHFTTAGGSAGDGADAAPGQRQAEANAAEIYVIAVDPDFQGLGLGKQLTLAGLDRMVERGATEALLYVAGENAAARRMYEQLGFVSARVDRAFVGEVPPARL